MGKGNLATLYWRGGIDERKMDSESRILLLCSITHVRARANVHLMWRSRIRQCRACRRRRLCPNRRVTNIHSVSISDSRCLSGSLSLWVPLYLSLCLCFCPFRSSFGRLPTSSILTFSPPVDSESPRLFQKVLNHKA
jgi:hypothetical protein